MKNIWLISDTHFLHANSLKWGMEQIDYTPVHIETLRDRLKKRI